MRPGGGVYASYWASPFMGDIWTFKFEERNEALAIVDETDGISPHIAAVDRLDLAVESLDAGVRWIDVKANPLSGTFSATADGAYRRRSICVSASYHFEGRPPLASAPTG